MGPKKKFKATSIDDDEADFTGKALADIRQMFDCPVCLEPFKDPRILPACGHHFCMACLERIARSHPDGAITCPSCRAVTEIKPDNLPKPFILNRVQAKITPLSSPEGHSTKNMICCDLCVGKQAKAKFYCGQCKEKLCDACNKKHSESPVFDGHQVVDIEQATFCEYHGLEKFIVAALCHTCDNLICVKCVFGAHDGHHSESIAAITKSLREKTKETKTIANNNLTRIKACTAMLNSEWKPRDADIQGKTRNKIEVKNHIRTLEILVDELHADYELKHARDLQPLAEIGEKLQDDRKACENMLDLCNNLASLRDIDLVKARGGIPSTCKFKEPLIPEIKNSMNASLQQLLEIQKVIKKINNNLDKGEWRREATFQLTVDNLMKDGPDFRVSEVVYVRGLPWVVKAKTSREADGATAEPKKCLSVYVECKGDKNTRDWSCKANVGVKILSYSTTGKPHKIYFHHEFNAKAASMGWPKFIQWSELYRTSSCLVQNNTVVIEATVIADVPEAAGQV